ncbi:MAG TPA: DUF4097 family beta strand repeat-containing protein [Gemmatimonadales bacterium]|jgi:DUF4097 and DUF4098 domain-containing protein YvlB|nr:DUF4097 family beta strand repeat-containing protein [Gemmatimonadales bacterium]
MTTSKGFLVAGLLALIAPAGLAAQASDFHWSGKLAAGQRLEIKGVNGAIHATSTSSGTADVTARKHARRSDPESVKIQVVTTPEAVTICAVYPTPDDADQENDCESGRHWHSNTRDNDVVVDFTIQVPAGSDFDGRTVNGDVEATGLGGNTQVSTVNGSIDVSTSGHAEANTVNGSIRATMGKTDFDDAEFRTVNGGITLTMPADLNTEVRAETVNGDLDSDWPVTITGRWGPRRMHGTIGKGGRTLTLGTVNGDIRLRKS